ncbi:MAG TPA: universal stress protein [Vicinamibacterales bacterium]
MIAIHNILVPTDFSDAADAALTYARELAEKFAARIELLHVVATPVLYPMGADASAVNLGQVIADVETSARQTLEEIAKKLALPPDRVSVRTCVGTPVTEILETITEDKIDLVVMGTHGHGMVEHLLLGSVAERVVRRSAVPVLTVHGLLSAGRAKGAKTTKTTARM